MTFRGISDDTPILPWIVAELVVDEVNRCYKLTHRKQLAEGLEKRAEAIYEANPHFRRDLRSRRNRGRDTLFAFMRHWLSADLRKTQPRVYYKLPSDFRMGVPLRCTSRAERATARRWR